MGNADLVTSSFMSVKKNFADAFNLAFYIYGYDIRVKAEELQELDTTLNLWLPLPNGETYKLGRRCDVFKHVKMYYDDKTYYMAMMIENQHYIHSGMPLKVLVYQMIDALKQVKDAMAARKKEQVDQADEFLSDYPKDFKLRPVIPLVIYFGAKEWTAPRNLSELYEEVPQTLQWLMPSFKYLLLCPHDIPVSKFKDVKSDISLALCAMKHARTRSVLSDFFKNDHDYDRISKELCELILANINYSPRSIGLKETNNMYDITHFWDESDQQLRQEGFLAGQQQGYLDGVETTLRGFISIGLSNAQIQSATGFTEERIDAIRRTMKEEAAEDEEASQDVHD